MLEAVIMLWVVSSTGIPSMSTMHTYNTQLKCEKEILRIERKYYLDREPHMRARSGERYHMACLTHEEVMKRLNEAAIDRAFKN